MPTPQHHLSNLFGMFETTSDKVYAALAAGAVATPLWRQYVQAVSEDAALFAPILGCVWLVVQIIMKILGVRREK